MLLIHYTSSFNALKEHINRYNASQENLSGKVRQAAAATAVNIIKIYGAFLTKANSIDAEVINDTKGLRITNVQLGKMGHASPRTIQRHIKRLIQAGIITKKVWHGSNSGYELWIHPDILLIKRRSSVENVEKASETPPETKSNSDDIQHISEILTPKCPHTVTCNNRYITNRIIDVDKSKSDLSNSGNKTTGNKSQRSSLSLTAKKEVTGDPVTGNTGGKGGEKNEETGGKGGKLRAENLTRRAGSPAEDKARTASLLFYASMLWTLAKNVLYRDVYLTKRQEKIAKELLLQWYEPVKTSSLSKVHGQYVERITLVRKYIAKDPQNRYVQLPYKYFDTSNPNGFTGTKKWHKEYVKHKKEVQQKLILHAQIRRFTHNQQKSPDNQKPPLELYRQCEMRVSKLNDPILLQEFHAAVLAPNVHQEFYHNQLVGST